MRDDPVLGELTEEDREAARVALEAAGHAWDLRAAALSGASGGRLAPVLRGGPARPGEGNTGRRSSFAGDLPPHDSLDSHDSEQWRQILSDLVDGRIGELVFVEFAPECVNVIKVVADGSGIPRQTDAAKADWSEVVPLLDHRPEIRRFQLAGGIGTLPTPSRGDFDAAVTRWLQECLPPSRAHSLVLLDRRAGWALLGRAAALLRATYPLRAELGPGPRVPAGADDGADADGTSTAEAVRRSLRTAPLLVDHTLLLARVDRSTGAVHAHTHVLFPAGARLGHGETATAEITVYGGLADRTPVVLPVLAGAPAGDGTGAVVLSARQAELAAFAPERLAFVLRGPGEVSPVEPSGESVNGVFATGGSHSLAAGGTPDLPALVGRLPRGIVRPPALDIFFTVEMSGADPAETTERLAFVQDVIACLDRRQGSGLRVGVVGHYDHVVHESGHAPRSVLLLPVPAGTAQDALAALATWRPARRTQDTASSLEDALGAVTRFATGRGSRARHHRTERTVLVVGRRPPALPEQHGVVPSCPLGADWRTELDTLRARGVRVLARADPDGPHLEGPPMPVRHYTTAAWAALSAEGSFRPGTDAAPDVAAALAPAWRWDGPPCRLAFAAPPL
ncbi:MULTISPECIES: hypothetical protein [unclassified Streptomyces]|uniref:hypothetical protein n=1 Tax=unclassified Streptomyces TaxID=2593676 RepID=UPI0035DB873A